MRFIFALLLLPILISAEISFADDGTDFTFKKIKPPSPNEKNRINIQVERTWPYDEATPKAPGSEETESTVPKTAENWFWSEVSPNLAAADPIRLDQALTILNRNASEKARIAPDVNAMNRIVESFGTDILVATAGKRVSPALVLAVIMVESGGRPSAESEKGAIGLMQLMPATAARFDVADPLDPKQNISGGVAYLDWLFGQFGGDPILSLAGYNAGENSIRKHNGVPPFEETRKYLPKIIAAWDRARMYCQTLPKFADDGCVFDLNRSFSN